MNNRRTTIYCLIRKKGWEQYKNECLVKNLMLLEGLGPAVQMPFTGDYIVGEMA